MYGKFGAIVFPYGFAGNHIRWLLFLDAQFTNPFGDQDLESKLKFIKEQVYTNERTWNTWLHTEWKFRPDLDKIIAVSHGCWEWEDHPLDKELYLTSDNYYEAFLHYYHINLGVNNNTPETLMKQMEEWCNEFEFVKRNLDKFPNKKLIKSDQIFNDTLSLELYQEIINFYGFDNNYESACQVHELFCECRRNSAKDFYNYFTSNEFDSILNNVYKISQGVFQ